MPRLFQKSSSNKSKNMYFYCFFRALYSIYTTIPFTKSLEIWSLSNWHSSVSSTKILCQCCSSIRSHIQISPKICVFIAILQHYAAFKPTYRWQRDSKLYMIKSCPMKFFQSKFQVIAASLSGAMFKNGVFAAILQIWAWPRVTLNS